MDVHRGGGANSRHYTLDLQVWRPSPTDQGCYSLVGNNRFTSVPLEITQVAKVTPLPQDCCIEVQPDDVLGFFVDNPNNEKNGVVAIDEIDNDPTMYSLDEVWYGNVQGYMPSDSECPYPIGTHNNAVLNTLRMAAPVISLAMSK